MAEDRVTWDSTGPSAAPAILLIHGALVTRAMWSPVAAALADEYRTTTLDLPGHGTLSRIPFTLVSSTREIARVVDSAAGARALVVGASLGGYAAIAFAATHPERVAGLVLSGATMELGGAVRLYLRALGWLFRTIDERFLLRLAEGRLRRAVPEHLARQLIADGLYPKAFGEALAELAATDFRALLRGFRPPLLILNGERDRASCRGAPAFAAIVMQARIRVIPGAGHACMLEQPEVYAAAVRDFARSIS